MEKRGEPTVSSSQDPRCSASRPGKTRRMVFAPEELIFDPEVDLVNCPSSLERGPASSLEVQDESSLWRVDHPIPMVARLTHRGQALGEVLSNLVNCLHVSSLVRLDFQDLLAQVGRLVSSS